MSLFIPCKRYNSVDYDDKVELFPAFHHVTALGLEGAIIQRVAVVGETVSDLLVDVRIKRFEEHHGQIDEGILTVRGPVDRGIRIIRQVQDG